MHNRTQDKKWEWNRRAQMGRSLWEPLLLAVPIRLRRAHPSGDSTEQQVGEVRQLHGDSTEWRIDTGT
jgi:hypothetical protein